MQIYLWHVERAIRIFEPNTTICYRRKPNPWFKHGTLFRSAVEALWAARHPRRTREIVDAILEQKGINVDVLSLADPVGSVERSLVYHRGRRVVAVGSRPVHWKLAD